MISIKNTMRGCHALGLLVLFGGLGLASCSNSSSDEGGASGASGGAGAGAEMLAYPDGPGCALLFGSAKDGSDATWDGNANEDDTFNAVDKCACKDTKEQGGCADVCDGDANGTKTADFCNFHGASAACAACLTASCADSITECLKD